VESPKGAKTEEKKSEFFFSLGIGSSGYPIRYYMAQALGVSPQTASSIRHP